ncbi:MAG: rod shape-determining protein MreC [Bacteroidia bacterium]
MRNLFQLLWNNNFFLLYVILQGVCFYLIVDEQKYHQAAVLNSANSSVAKIMSTVNEAKVYLALRQNNESLALENAQQKAFDSTKFFDTRTQTFTIKDTAYLIQYTYTPAKVVNNNTNKRNNFLTLDKGLANGIRPDMGVISAGGAVGVVKDVSEHFATVQSLLHSKTKASVRLKNGFYGPLTWDGVDPKFATISDISANVPVHKGDTIITTSFSTLFPEGILVGHVEKVEANPAGDFLKITVRLSANFSNLSYVYIVNNKFKLEQQQLEAHTDSVDKNAN